MSRIVILVAVLVVVLTGSASADPVLLSYSRTFAFISVIPGVSVGDVVMVDVVVDNGAATTFSQTWSLATDFVSATVTVGTYSATYATGSGIWVTNASGAVAFVSGCNVLSFSGGSDNFGVVGSMNCSVRHAAGHGAPRACDEARGSLRTGLAARSRRLRATRPRLSRSEPVDLGGARRCRGAGIHRPSHPPVVAPHPVRNKLDA
jgi:hypothetical protein